MIYLYRGAFTIKTSVIWASFILSLITNIIVLSGTISFLIWLEQLSNTWINRFRPQVETVLCTIYFTYLWGESWLNSSVAPAAFGMHWAFLNMLIISSFLLNVYLNLPFATAAQVVLMIAYIWHYSKQMNFFTVIYSLAFIAVVFASYHWGTKLLQHPVMMYLGMDTMAVVSFALIMSIFSVPTDPYFWLRQLASLEILSVLGIEYTLASNRLLEHTNQVAELAKLDGLTQLYNFSKFDKDLSKAYENFQTNQEPYAVFEFDIDHFKQINDSFGHLAGNTVLKAVAQELTHFAASTPYQSDAYRIGGEEFCLIVREDCSSYKFATGLANHIRQRISQLAFKFGNSFVHVTVSVGQANSRPDQYNVHDIYKLADRSLYLSKQRGRDRVTLEGCTVNGR